MLVEAPVLDGDEGFGNVGRQFLQRQRRAGKVAAAGQRTALEVDDLDRRRAFGNFQRLDRRQMGADPGNETGAADRNPKADDQRPICKADNERPLTAGRA